jgi:uncharacterized membrane protein (DUF4010 family)
LTRGRAFNLYTAVLLAVTVAAVLLLASVLNEALGRSGAVLGTAVAGFADSQSAAASAATLVESGRLAASEAAIAVLAAVSTNTLAKIVLAFTLGTRGYAVRVSFGLALVLGCAWAGYAVAAAGGLLA